MSALQLCLNALSIQKMNKTMTFLLANKKMSNRERVAAAYAPAIITLIFVDGYTQYSSVSLLTFHVCPWSLYLVSYYTVTTERVPDTVTTFLANARSSTRWRPSLTREGRNEAIQHSTSCCYLPLSHEPCMNQKSFWVIICKVPQGTSKFVENYQEYCRLWLIKV